MSGFRDRKRAKQLFSFEGMERRFGLKPTDIDGFRVTDINTEEKVEDEVRTVSGYQEYGGKLFIFFEGKYSGATMSSAQSQALASICYSHYKEDVEPKDLKHVVWALAFNHEVHDTEEDVIVKDQYVTNVCSSIYPEWRIPESHEVVPKFELTDGNITVLEAIIQIENWCEENNIRVN